jgi:pSer/pThr/pTyr-binding forkhead associated (FHA) protein
MWVLATDEGAEFPFTFRILPGSVKTIGRAARADFILDAPLVSRLHCRITAGAAELEVVDLESTNGTFVNGERIERATLRGGEKIGVGRVELSVVRSIPETATPPDPSDSNRSSGHQEDRG